MRRSDPNQLKISSISQKIFSKFERVNFRKKQTNMFSNLKGVFEKLGAGQQPAALKAEEQLRAQQAQRRREADSRAAVRFCLVLYLFFLYSSSLIYPPSLNQPTNL
jgi:hypothetical protein